MIPQTEQALLEKAQSIAGLTFGELADELNIPIASNVFLPAIPSTAKLFFL